MPCPKIRDQDLVLEFVSMTHGSQEKFIRVIFFNHKTVLCTNIATAEAVISL